MALSCPPPPAPLLSFHLFSLTYLCFTSFVCIACLLPRIAAEASSTSTTRTRKQTRRPWCYPRRTTATPTSATPSGTAPRPPAASPQITATSTPPHPLQPPPCHLITIRLVSEALFWFWRVHLTFRMFMRDKAKWKCACQRNTVPFRRKNSPAVFCQTFLLCRHSSTLLLRQGWEGGLGLTSRLLQPGYCILTVSVCVWREIFVNTL